MKNLKFRAWHRLSKQMYYGGELIGFNTMESDIQHEDVLYIGMDGKPVLMNSDRTYEVTSDEFEVMQFTGLTDKSGKEIYEGDIVFTFIGGLPFNLKVKWEGGEYKAINNANEHAVVGNIFENPEILARGDV